MNAQQQVLYILRNDVGAIMLGSVLLFIGLATLGIVALRRRSGDRTLIWFGLFAALYGARIMAQMGSVFYLLPQSVWYWRPFVIVFITYIIGLPALLFWFEFSQGLLRRVLRFVLVFAAAFSATAISVALLTGDPERLMRANNV